MPIFGLTAEELDGALNRLWDLLTSGHSDEEARHELKLSHADYHLLKSKMFEREMARHSAKTAEETYIQYVIDQIQNIRDLTMMIKEFKSSKQYNAMVGAVKARAELNDKLLKMGQDLGVIDKQPDRHEVIAGISVMDLTSKQLKAMITSELRALGKLMSMHGGVSIKDITPGPTHIPAKKVKALPAAGEGDKRMRVAKGRRVVREKAKK